MSQLPLANVQCKLGVQYLKIEGKEKGEQGIYWMSLLIPEFGWLFFAPDTKKIPTYTTT
jgi:hypothetical protein